MTEKKSHTHTDDENEMAQIKIEIKKKLRINKTRLDEILKKIGTMVEMCFAHTTNTLSVYNKKKSLE